MSDTTSGAAKAGANPLENLPRVSIVSQFVKDLSFENPNASDSQNITKAQPKINLSVDVKARRLAAPHFQVDLHLTIEAKQGDKMLFLTELVYGGIFLLHNIPAENLQPCLLIECPRLLFPFARRIIADVTRDGGYVPMMLDPIDFAVLYRQQLAATAKSGASPVVN